MQLTEHREAIATCRPIIIIIVSLAHAYTCICIHAPHAIGLLTELDSKLHPTSFSFELPEKCESSLPEEEG